ncbi:hypothetical protein TWF694_006942 [Orbilia ellipsospora]|uniref:F-box domain-containing protein n=1 Tax=Orbilia ellipsospora TaxID=2528407 RepID=A0AAV9XN70_9PEZI
MDDLTTLPVELIAPILKNLDEPSLLAVSQTCSLLRSISLPIIHHHLHLDESTCTTSIPLDTLHRRRKYDWDVPQDKKDEGERKVLQRWKRVFGIDPGEPINQPKLTVPENWRMMKELWLHSYDALRWNIFTRHGFYDVLMRGIENGDIELRTVHILITDIKYSSDRKWDLLEAIKKYGDRTSRLPFFDIQSFSTADLLGSKYFPLTKLTGLLLRLRISHNGKEPDRTNTRRFNYEGQDPAHSLAEITALLSQTPNLKTLNLNIRQIFDAYNPATLLQQIPAFQAALDSLTNLNSLTIASCATTDGWRTMYGTGDGLDAVFLHPSVFIHPPENVREVEYNCRVTREWWTGFVNFPFKNVESMTLYLAENSHVRGEYGSIDHVAVKTLKEFEWGYIKGSRWHEHEWRDNKWYKVARDDIEPFPEDFEDCIYRQNPRLTDFRKRALRKKALKEIRLQHMIYFGKMLKKVSEEMADEWLERREYKEGIKSLVRGEKRQGLEIVRRMARKIANDDNE